MSDREASRLLLVSWHFPPDAAVGGVRWQKLARFAVERGWQVDVVMRDLAGIAGRDDARVADLPRSTRVVGVPIPPSPMERVTDLVARLVRAGAKRAPALKAGLTQQLGSIATSDLRFPRNARDFARAWHAWVEHRRGERWARDASIAAQQLMSPGSHRIIVSCGPPHWAHRAALLISRASGVPFATDLRDPWSQVQRLPEHLASPLMFALAGRAEREVVGEAALVVANTDRACVAMRRKYPARAAQIIASPNGFDDDPLPPAPRSQRFVVAYAGTIYLDRDPRPLLRAASRVIIERRPSPDTFGIEFLGDVSAYDGRSLADIAREEGVEEFVKLSPPVPRQQAMEFLAKAAVLVVLPQDSDYAIPAKLFEYVRFPAWVLVCGPRDGAARSLVEPLGADGAEGGDVDALTAILLRRFDDHRRGTRAVPLARHVELGRRARAAALFDRIEAITGAPVPPRAAERSSLEREGDGSATPRHRSTAPLSAPLRAERQHEW